MKTLLRLCIASLLGPLLANMTYGQTLEWVNAYGTAGTETATAVAVDGSGNAIFVGSFSGTIDFDPGPETQEITANSTDFYIQKVDSDGALIWAYGIGGTSGDFAYDVAVDASDNIYVAGAYRNTVDFDPRAGIAEMTGTTNASLFVLKLTSGGGFEWVYAPGSGEAIALDTDASGNVYVTGYNLAAGDFDNTAGTDILGGNGLSDVFLVKLNSSGVYQSGVSFGGTGSEIGQSLVVDDLGNIYLGGTFSATVDFDPGTGTEELISEGGTDAFVLRLTSSMEYSLVYALGGTSDDHLNSMAVTSNYSIMAVGDFLGTVDLNPFEGVSESTATNRDAFVLKVSELGVFEWVNVINFGSAVEGFTVAVDDNDHVYAGGAIAPLYIYDAAGTSLFNGFNTGVTLYDIAVDGANFYVAASHSSGSAIVDFEPCGTGTNPGWTGGTDMAHVKYAIDRLADEPTIFANTTGFCGSSWSATLMVTAGSLNDAADWYWYSGSCGGTLLGTGTSIDVNLSETTTYYVRGGGNSCITGTGPCGSWTIPKYDPPTNILLSNLTVAENLDAGAVIGDLSAVDATPDDTHTFEMNFESNGNNYDNAFFNVVNDQLVTSSVFDFETKSSYTVRVRVEDAAGCSYSKTFAITIVDVDEIPPVLSAVSPADDATDVATDANLVLTFDKEVQPINNGFIIIKFDVGTNKEVINLDQSNVAFSGNTITINPDNNLDYSTEFYIYIPSNAIEDVSGNAFAGFTDSETWNFVVEAEPDITAPSVLNFTPAHNATAVDVNPTQLQLSFNENIQLGAEGQVQIKKVTDDAIFLSANSTTEGLLTISNNVLIINLSSPFDYETQYYVSIASGVVEDLSGNSYSGLDNTTAWRFTTQIEPFNLVSLSPANGAVDVDNTINFTLSFNKNASIGAGNINIYRSDNDSPVASLSNYNGTYMSISGVDITFNFPGDLLEGTEYYIQVSDGYLRSAANASNTWSGIQDKTSWSFTTNQVISWNGSAWSNGTGPTSEDDAVINGYYSFSSNGSFMAKDLMINSGVTLIVDGENFLYLDGDLTNNGNMTVESGASLITNGVNVITGNDITFKRNTSYADGKYSFVGSPVEQSASITGEGLGSSVYKYLENVPFGADGINRWEDASGNQLVPGRGYTQAFQKEIVFVGKPNTGMITYSGTYSEDVDDAYEGWNLVSNPYPAAISVASFLGGNFGIGGAVYIWDDNGSDTGRGSNNDYIVANGSVATNTTPAGGQSEYNLALGSSQGFFVKLNSSFNKNIVFTEGMRLTGQNSDDNFFRKAEEQPSYLRINLTNQEGLFKQAVLGWLDNISDTEVDRRFDAQVFNAKADYSIYTIKANTPLAIQGITSQKKEVPLGLNVAESGSYTMAIDLENYTGLSVYLKDNVTGETVDLTSGAYTFSSAAGQITDRFVLTTTSGILALDDQKVNVYAVDKVLHIETAGFQPAEYLMYNLSGKRIMQVLISGTTKIDLNHVPNGVYLISDGIETKKIILK